MSIIDVLYTNGISILLNESTKDTSRIFDSTMDQRVLLGNFKSWGI